MMYMMKKICAALLPLMLVLPCAQAADELSFTARSDNEKGLIRVEGRAFAPWGKRKVSVLIIRPSAEGNVGVNTSPEEFLSKVYSFRIVSCDENGAFNASFPLDKMTAEAGYYTVRAAASAIPAEAVSGNDQKVLYVSEKIASEVIGKLNSAKNHSETAEIIDGDYSEAIKNSDILSLDTESEIYKLSKNEVCKYLFNMRSYDGIGRLQAAFKRSCALADIETCGPSELAGKLEKYSSELELNAVLSRPDYVGNKEDVCALIKYNRKNIVNYSDYKTEKTCPAFFIKQLCAVTSVNNAGTYERAYEAVKENAELLGIDFSDYNGYGKLSEYEVSKCMNIEGGRKFTSAEQIKSVVDERIKALLNDRKGAESSGGSSKGGGGGVSIGTQRPPAPIAKPKAEAGIVYSDVSNEHWAYSAISELTKDGVLSGIGNGEFQPSSPVLREQLAKIVTEAFDIKPCADSAFDDVEISAWYAPYVNAAYKAGITNGVAENRFGVGTKVSRQDLIVMIYRAMKNSGYVFSGEGKTSFADAGLISGYASEAVGALCGEGIVNGTETGIEPLRGCTRAEAANIIYKALQKMNRSEETGIYEN